MEDNKKDLTDIRIELIEKRLTMTDAEFHKALWALIGAAKEEVCQGMESIIRMTRSGF